MVYRPEHDGRGPSVVVVAPDGEERVWAARALVRSARALAAAGCTVLRFDYRGQGESEGEYTDTTLDTLVDDLRAACTCLRQRTGQAPDLLGVRLGATIAILAAGGGLEVQSLVLWEPVVDTGQYLHMLLRVNVSTQMVTHGRVLKERPALIAAARAGEPVSINGFNVTGAFVDALLSVEVVPVAERLTVPMLMVASGPPDARLSALPSMRTERVPIVPFWKEPKVHVAGEPAFLMKTVEWFAPRQQGLREVS